MVERGVPEGCGLLVKEAFITPVGGESVPPVGGLYEFEGGQDILTFDVEVCELYAVSGR